MRVRSQQGGLLMWWTSQETPGYAHVNLARKRSLLTVRCLVILSTLTGITGGSQSTQIKAPDVLTLYTLYSSYNWTVTFYSCTKACFLPLNVLSILFWKPKFCFLLGDRLSHWVKMHCRRIREWCRLNNVEMVRGALEGDSMSFHTKKYFYPTFIFIFKFIEGLQELCALGS